jgi:Holliday junction resolvase
MSNYRKGAGKEYDLSEYLWEDGWWTTRQAASGAVGHEACDVMAIKNGRVLLFEVKTGELPIRTDGQLAEAENRIDFDEVDGGAYNVYYGDGSFKYTSADNTMIREDNLTMLIHLIRQ